MSWLGLGLGIDDASEGSDPSAGYALYLPFSASSPTYRSGATTSNVISGMPGYAYTRTGAKQELLASAAGVSSAFAANAPGITTAGYYSRSGFSNLNLQAQAFDNASWVKNGGTITADTVAAPDGTTTADTFTRSAVAEQHLIQDNAPSVLIGNPYTKSVFAKQGSGRYLQVCLGTSGGAFPATAYVNFDLQAGTLSAAAGATGYIVNCGNGWYRCIAVATCAASGGPANYFAMVDSLAAGQLASGAGDSSTIHLWGGQFSAGAFPDGAAYAASAGATAAVGEDLLKVTMGVLADADTLIWLNGTSYDTNPAQDVLNLSDASAANMVRIYRSTTDTYCVITSASATVYSFSVPYVTGQRTSYVLRRKSGQWRFGKVVAGAITWGSVDTTAAMPANLATVTVGNYLTGTGPFNGPVEGAFVKVATYATDAAVIAAVA